MQLLKIFIGYDEREHEAYEVCASSIRRHTSIPVGISKVDQKKMRERGIYTRPEDEPASTQFAFTRFFVPYACDFKGYAMFCDCDFLFTRDIAEILKYLPVFDSVACVKHDYVPRAAWKMDGQPQVNYPKKNWSSLMLFNNELCDNLTPYYCNTASGADLHQMKWARPDRRAFEHKDGIAEIPLEFNWLEGEYDWPFDGTTPAGIHFTNGGPWHKTCQGVRFGNLWRAEKADLR